jgi:hypothetical protein
MYKLAGKSNDAYRLVRPSGNESIYILTALVPCVTDEACGIP